MSCWTLVVIPGTKAEEEELEPGKKSFPSLSSSSVSQQDLHEKVIIYLLKPVDDTQSKKYTL